VLAQMGSAWLAQLLLCVFDSLQQERPGGIGYQTQSSVAVASAAAKAATAELRKLLLLPMSDGNFAVVDNDTKQPLYFPLDMGDESQGGLYRPMSILRSSPCWHCCWTPAVSLDGQGGTLRGAHCCVTLLCLHQCMTCCSI